MLCKNLFGIAVLLAASILNLSAAPDSWVWPIAGKSCGSDIIYQPQQYIDSQLNTASIFVECREGEQIVAPAEGQIIALKIYCMHAMAYLQAYDYDPSRELRPQAEAIVRDRKLAIDSRYLCGAITIKLDDGRKLTICGIDIKPGFRTGQRIDRQTVIGTAGYSYNKITSPSISVSVSDSNGKVADPMTPFGLRTTFISPKSVVIKDRFTAEEARRDILTITAVMREAYPSLDEMITAEEFDALEKGLLDSVADGVSRGKFYRLMQHLYGRIHDSHITLYPDQEGLADRASGNSYPQIFFG